MDLKLLLKVNHMLTNEIQPQTTLVVDWSDRMDYEPGTEMVEYDTSTVPFRRYRKKENFYSIRMKESSLGWVDTNYNSIEHIESNGGDIVWVKKGETNE